MRSCSWTGVFAGTSLHLFCHTLVLPHITASLSECLAPLHKWHTHYLLLLLNYTSPTPPPPKSPSIHQHNSLIIMPMTQLHQYPTMIPPHGHNMNGQGVGHKSLHRPLHMMLQLWCAMSLKKAWHEGQCYVLLPTPRPDSYPSLLHQMSKNSQHQT